ncbi:uncharacterized protein [Miscanthus floridulus]|uniref:uncharacterized protein n=1 Tax=Miscanthus floridulus TaxID=154761 RepID=UPI00345AC9AA
MAATRKLHSASAAASGDHLRFLRPGALARLRDARLRRGSRTTRLPPPSSPAPAPASPSSPPPAAGDGEGVTAVPFFAPASRLLAPLCPRRKKLAAAKSVVLFTPPPPSPDLPVEFLSAPDMVVAAH